MNKNNILLDRSGEMPYIISIDNEVRDMNLSEKNENRKFILKELRKKTGMNQTEFAERLGFTQTTVSNWENGDCVLSVQNLYKVCELLDTTPDILYGYASDRVTLETPCIVFSDGKHEPLGDAELAMIMTLLSKLRSEPDEDALGKEFYLNK